MKKFIAALFALFSGLYFVLGWIPDLVPFVDEAMALAIFVKSELLEELLELKNHIRIIKITQTRQLYGHLTIAPAIFAKPVLAASLPFELIKNHLEIYLLKCFDIFIVSVI